MSSPSLSVIISNYNNAEFLPQFLQSVVDQSVQPKEIIIIDDASTDNSVEILEEFARKYPIVKFIRNKTNQKPVICYYKIGLEAATGDFIIGLAVDDTYLPDFFEKHMEILEKYPRAGMSIGLCLLKEEGTMRLDTLPPFLTNEPLYLSPEKVLQAMINRDWFIMAHTALWRREAVKELKGFPMELSPYLDEFTFLMLALNYGVCFIPEPLAVYNIRPNTFSSNHGLTQYFELRRKQEEFMETQYADKFPPAFVEYHKKTTRYREGIMHLDNWSETQKECTKYLEKALPKNNFINRTFHWLNPILSNFQKSFLKLYLYLRLGRLTWVRAAQYFHPSRKKFKPKEMPVGDMENSIKAAHYFQELINQEK